MLSKLKWGTELWDQYDAVAQHTQKGLESLDRYENFLKDRASIEVEYAAKLRKLAKSYQLKKKEKDDIQFTCHKAFKQMLNEINDLGGQHERISEDLNEIASKEVHQRTKELKDEKKKHLSEGQRHQNNLQNYISNLDRAKKTYEKSFRESEKALETFQRAEADLHLSRAEVEKIGFLSTNKAKQCEDMKMDYANHLDKTNTLKNTYYNVQMPSVLEGLQDIDQKRIHCLKENMKQTTEMERGVQSIVDKCMDGILKAAEEIDEEADSNLVVEKLKTGLQPPADIPFEDLTAIKMGEAIPLQNSVNRNSQTKLESLINQSPISIRKPKKLLGKLGIFSNQKPAKTAEGDYSELPPNQRRKKLQRKIDEYSQKIQQENSAKDALIKMQSVYESNPKLGDPESIEGQLQKSIEKLQSLELDLQKYQSYLNEMDTTENHLGVGQGALQNRSSSSDLSLSRSSLELNQNNNFPPPPPPEMLSETYDPESGVRTSETSLPDSDFEQNDDDDAECNSPFPVLGTCEALYAFEGVSEGNLSVGENEQLYVVELDPGNGWTIVRRQNSMEEGFVPTSYLKITLY